MTLLTINLLRLIRKWAPSFQLAGGVFSNLHSYLERFVSCLSFCSSDIHFVTAYENIYFTCILPLFPRPNLLVTIICSTSFWSATCLL